MPASTWLQIPREVSDLTDSFHNDRLYRVCRFCAYRVTLRKGQLRAPPPSEAMCTLATRFYKIDFKDELTNTRLPKVLCDGCKRRLCRLRDNEHEQAEWEEHKRFYVSGTFWHYEPVKTRGTVICSAENRCKVCCIYAEKKSNTLQKKHSAAPQKGRPLQQSPPRPMCSKCGQYMDSEHDLSTCDGVKKRPRSSGVAGRNFSERVDTRGYTGAGHMRP
ncbi:hypothetical protein FOZ60_015801 [Perkinsus olseni]|uniref:Uncharacterized protein n=2 Tax=Perkinsus olseni TaxID=32597 RepID=A0A7J6N4W2_PEROL|nr:hypothetical protein FOZ60_015801 [Perkinsus olseni]